MKKYPSWLRTLFLSFCLATSAVSCGVTGQTEIRLPISVSSTGGDFSVGAWQISLTRAELGFGPLYFCATAAASASLCPSAVAEFSDTARVDLLRTAPNPLGELFGVTGVINSATYDFGVVWGNTDRQPLATPAAPDGHSAIFEGTATRGDTRFAFRAELDLLAQFQGARVIQGARTHVDLSKAAPGTAALTVQFEPAVWFSQVDFDSLQAAGADTPVLIGPGTSAYNGLVIGIGALAPPTFVWRGVASKPEWQ